MKVPSLQTICATKTLQSWLLAPETIPLSQLNNTLIDTVFSYASYVKNRMS